MSGERLGRRAAVQSWRGIKKTEPNLQARFLKPFWRGRPRFLSRTAATGDASHAMLNYITIILTYIALSAEVSDETARSGANQPAGAATGGAEGVRMMVTVRVIKLPQPLPASVASRGFFAPQARKFWDFEPF